MHERHDASSRQYRSIPGGGCSLYRGAGVGDSHFTDRSKRLCGDRFQPADQLLRVAGLAAGFTERKCNEQSSGERFGDAASFSKRDQSSIWNGQHSDSLVDSSEYRVQRSTCDCRDIPDIRDSQQSDHIEHSLFRSPKLRPVVDERSLSGNEQPERQRNERAGGNDHLKHSVLCRSVLKPLGSERGDIGNQCSERERDQRSSGEYQQLDTVLRGAVFSSLVDERFDNRVGIDSSRIKHPVLRFSIFGPVVICGNGIHSGRDECNDDFVTGQSKHDGCESDSGSGVRNPGGQFRVNKRLCPVPERKHSSNSHCFNGRCVGQFRHADQHKSLQQLRRRDSVQRWNSDHHAATALYGFVVSSSYSEYGNDNDSLQVKC